MYHRQHRFDGDHEHRFEALTMARARATERSDPLEWFLHSLHHLGWPGGTVPRHKLTGLKDLGGSAQYCALALPDGQPLVIVSCAGEMPPPSAAYEIFEDFSPEHRLLSLAFGKLGIDLRYVVILAPSGRAQLVDFAQEEVLVAADSRSETGDRILPLFETASVLRGSLVTHPRKSPLRRAHELEHWTRLWETRLGSSLDMKRPPVERFFRALHLARLATRLGYAPRMGVTFEDFATPTKSPDALKALRGLWRHLAKSTGLLHGHRLEELEGIATLAAEKELLAPLLASFGRLSSAKFSAEIFAEAFADADLRSLSWREGILDPALSAREDGASRRVVESWVADIDACGLTVLLRGFDRIAEDVRLCRADLAMRERQGEIAGLQMEFFGFDPSVPDEEETVAFILADALRAVTSSATRADVARMVLLARGAELNARLHRFDAVLPNPRIDVSSPAAPPPPAAPVPAPSPRIRMDPSSN
jgi:hypothetical protein